MKKVAVFCGSRNGKTDEYTQKAYALGEALAKENIELIYGGGSVGLMGAVANGILDAGGKATGIIPKILFDLEVAHNNLTELLVVKSMHERKAKMYELSDAFIVMPGGIGTLEEFFEVFTWSAIGEHQKPCGIYNVNNYYDPMLHLLEHMVEEQFLTKEIREWVSVHHDAAKLIKELSDIIY